jgi:hypothetical protein
VQEVPRGTAGLERSEVVWTGESESLLPRKVQTPQTESSSTFLSFTCSLVLFYTLQFA